MGLNVRPEELAHLHLSFKKAEEVDKRSLTFRDPGIDSGYISISEERSNNSQAQGKWLYHVCGTETKQGISMTKWSYSEKVKDVPSASLLVNSYGPNIPSIPSILLLSSPLLLSSK